VLLALLAVGGLYLALPEYLTVGPTWILPAAVGALALSTLAFHRLGRHQLDQKGDCGLGELRRVRVFSRQGRRRQENVGQPAHLGRRIGQHPGQ